MTDLLLKSREELESLLSTLGGKSFHGRQVHAWIHHRAVTDFDAMTDLSRELRDKLASRFSIRIPSVVEEAAGDAPDSATKFLLELHDGARVEVVYIPSEERRTLCLSSQVGCAFGCTFCATARLGFARNLTAAEMVGSHIVVRQRCKERISNVVFMGMGEPLANLANVMRAWRVLTDPNGIALSRRKVTISTVGLPDRIRRLAEEPYPPKLVFSIASPYDEVRRRLLPVAGKFSLAQNHAALTEYARRSRNRITIALMIADGLNDRIEDARALHRWIGDLPAKVNLIRFNEIDESSYKFPVESKVEAVVAELARLGRTVVLRASRGRDIHAACGQLAGREVVKA